MSGNQRPSDSANKRVRLPSFKLECPGTANDSKRIRDKIRLIKDAYPDNKMNNTDIIEMALNSLLSRESVAPPETTASETNQMFLCDGISLHILLSTVARHTRECHLPLHLEREDLHSCGAVAMCSLSCTLGHVIRWTSSCYLPDGQFRVNARLMHEYLCSGLLTEQFDQFQEILGLEKLSASVLKQHVASYSNEVQEEKTLSCERALRTEIAMSEETEGAISIMTDARHGCRRNAKDTNVICIGHKTHQVLRDEHVTRADDICTQRHELLGTKMVYKYFDSDISDIGGSVSVHAHAHDRNASVNKYLRDERTDTINQNDTWHAAKSVEKEISRVAKGPKYRHRRDWHEQISDKVHSVRLHVQYSMRNCNGDAEDLRQRLDNITEHYQNRHARCPYVSRCRTDQNYEPSKQFLSDPVAVNLLRNAIRKTVVYQHPEDFVHAMDTFYVESFNNVLNIFHDKRIYFGDASYKLRTGLAMCHWNCNVDRPHTSVNQTNGKPKKVLVKRKYDYRDKIWERYISSLD